MAYMGEAGIKILGNLKHNLSALVNPSVTDDVNADYQIGSRWVNTATNEEYVCADNAAGAAVWEHTTTATENFQNASQVPFTPTGGISSTNTQAAVAELDTEKEPAFAKNTAFNKNFGTSAGTVAEGNHNHDATYINTSGDTMTGNLILNADPTVALGAATKQYVDNSVGSASGHAVQEVYTLYTTQTSTPTSFAGGVGIPTNTDGTQFFSATITPTNASNLLKIEVVLNCVSSVSGSYAYMAIFQDAIVNALNAATTVTSNVGLCDQIVITHWMIAGTVSPTTFKLRAGPSVGGTLYINRTSGFALLGGTYTSSMTVTEYQV